MDILAGDVGGTKVNLGWYDAAAEHPDGRAAPAPRHEATFLASGFADFDAVVQRFLDELGARRPARFAAAAFGVAGPVGDGRVTMPNLGWRLDARALAEQLGTARVALVNDLVATAHGIPALQPDELRTLQAGDGAVAGAPAALIAAGTGLGTSILVPAGDGWQPLASEGGHVDFAPRDGWGEGLLHHVQRELPDHVSNERIVSGPGVLRIFRYLVETGEAVPEPAIREAIRHDEAGAPAIIGRAGVSGECPACVATLAHFARLYGAVAGDLALVALARGGVYVGGGIAPKILPVLEQGGFAEAFVAKGRYRALLERIPVQVVLQPDTAALGAARLAATSAGA